MLWQSIAPLQTDDRELKNYQPVSAAGSVGNL
jgi:hypothetical protein